MDEFEWLHEEDDGKTHRNWLCTISKEKGWPKGAPKVLSEGVRFMCGQLERGEESGFLHYQVYISFYEPTRRAGVHKALNAGLPNVRGVRKPVSAYNYCMKDDPTFVGERFELGIRDKRLIRYKNYKPAKSRKKEKLAADVTSSSKVAEQHDVYWRAVDLLREEGFYEKVLSKK